MLWGTVHSQSEHAKAEELARVEGVVRVDDRLEGGRSHGSLQAISDAAISMKLKTQYMAEESLKHEHIVVTTTDGVVTLSGSVPSDRVRRRVIQIADSTEGVKRVITKLDVVAPR